MRPFIWWFGIFISFLLLLSVLIFGIYILIISYSLHNPLVFIATFFSSCLLILVCLSLIAGLVVKIVTRLKENAAKSQSIHD